MRRSTALGFTMVVIAAVAFGEACTFPSVTYLGDGGRDATTLDSAKDDGGAIDAREEAPPPDFPDANPDVFNPCDQDKDGYKAVGCEGGKDCNDFDKRAHPGQDFISDVPSGPPNGDWDCSGEPAERQYPTVNCAGLATIVNCTGEGFVTDPGCGQVGKYVKCTWSIGCGSADAGSRVQGCR